MPKHLRGILPAVVTPLTPAGEFAPAAFELLLARVYRAGVHGVYVCGTTGEGLRLPVGVRQSVAEAAVRNSPAGKLVIVHVGAAKITDAVKLARHAQRIGAHAISSLPPQGTRNFAAIRNYYRSLAGATDLPFLVYFMPEVCPGITTLDQILGLCEIPNVAGLKFTDFDLFKLHSIKHAGHTIFNGRDEVLAAGLLMGADGGIGSTYNLVPELYVELYDLASREEWQAARRVQDKVNELIAILLRFPILPAIKALLTWEGPDCGPCLSRPHSLSKSQHALLRNLIRRSSFAEYPFAGLGSR